MVRKKREIIKISFDEQDRIKQILDDEDEEEEGSEMTNKKVDTNFTISIDDKESYNWIGFNLDDKYYIGFESSIEVQAIVVSKDFFEAFKKEFSTS